MAVKDLGSAGGKGNGKPKTDTDPSAPWRVNPDTQQRERNGRLLPFEVKLRELLVGISGTAALAGDQFVSAAIDSKRDELAYGYAKLAKENDSVKRVLEIMFTGSAWAEALIPTVGLVAVVGWHFGMVPDQVGVPLTMASGIVPMSRESEVEMRKRAAAQAAQAAQHSETPPNESDTSGHKPSAN